MITNIVVHVPALSSSTKPMSMAPVLTFVELVSFHAVDCSLQVVRNVE